MILNREKIKSEKSVTQLWLHFNRSARIGQESIQFAENVNFRIRYSVEAVHSLIQSGGI